MTYINISDSQLDELIQHLNGTCLSLDEACQQCFNCSEDQLKQEQLQEIDQQLFRCETCSWWFERGEEVENANGDELCEQCAE